MAKTRLARAKRLSCTCRAWETRVRMAAEPSPPGSAASSRKGTAATCTWMIDAVQQRPGDAGAVLLNLLGGAGAGLLGVAVIAAEAGIHRGHQHEAGREGDGGGGPGDGDHAVFQGLAQHLQGGALEFRQFVQEEDAVVGQAHLPRPGGGAAADEPGVGDGVVRGPKGPPAQEPLARLEQPHDAVNLGGLQGLFLVQGRQDGRQALGQHGLARARRADHQDVVAAGRGQQQGPLHRLLALDLAEIQVVVRRRLAGLGRRGRGKRPGAPGRSGTPPVGPGCRRDRSRSPGPPRPPGRCPGG